MNENVVSKEEKLLTRFAWVVAFSLLLPTTALAQTVQVTNTPRTFTAVMPTSWAQQPTTTGNSRVKFASPQGAPPAECAVIVIDSPGLRGQLQTTFDQKMAEIPSTSEMASQLSSRYNNVKILTTGAANISGHLKLCGFTPMSKFSSNRYSLHSSGTVQQRAAPQFERWPS